MSTIKVNTVTTRSGCTVTLGESGKTVALASGASQTGFGRTGTVDWDTTAKTASFTAVSGNGYFVNTTSGTITVTLPASPSAGDIVSIADYTRTFATNKCTVARNSKPIGGVSANADLDTNGQTATFIYVDGTEGWINVQETSNSVTGTPPFVAATGGTIATCGDYKIHTFTSPGTFTVTSAGTPAGSTTLDYLVVAGGGSGGNDRGGGGGAGGVRFYASPDITSYPASPRNGPAALTASEQDYPVTVGAGATAQPGTTSTPSDGSNSSFSTITSAGGGGGGSGQPSNVPGGNGGSGGGARDATSGSNPGSGNTPPVSPAQGSNGGDHGNPGIAGGGGGFLGAGKDGGSPPASACNGAGGVGGGFPTAFVSSNGEASSCEQYFGGGGAGGTCNTANNFGGLGGGGNGNPPSNPACAQGSANTGGGGGGGQNGATTGAAGGSGIVIIRYKFQ